MIDCPDSLYSGADLILSLNIYIRAAAFATPSTSSSSQSKRKLVINEGQETAVEQMLRERKESLMKLFDAVSLRPDVERNIKDKKQTSELQHEDILAMTQSGGRKGSSDNLTQGKPRTEIVGDGEEVEIDEDDGELSENQLDVIYRKCVGMAAGLSIVFTPRFIKGASK